MKSTGEMEVSTYNLQKAVQEATRKLLGNNIYMKKTIKQQHIEYFEKYKKGYTYSAYKQKRGEGLCDAEINDLFMFKNSDNIKQFRHNMEEQVRREFFTDTEEGFDWEDLEYIKKMEYVH